MPERVAGYQARWHFASPAAPASGRQAYRFRLDSHLVASRGGYRAKLALSRPASRVSSRTRPDPEVALAILAQLLEARPIE